MAKIAVDIDSTLYDFSTLCREGFLRLARDRGDDTLKRGAYNAWTEWRSPVDASGLQPFLDVLDYCHDNDVILSQTPFLGAVETCQALANEGHELLYISNRRVESTQATREWLEDWEFPLSAVCPNSTNSDVCSDPDCDFGCGEHKLLCMMDEKAEHIADCQYLIDDRPRTVIDFVYDFDWESRLRRQHGRITRLGPGEGEPFYEESVAGLQTVLDFYYDGEGTTDAYTKLHAIHNKAADQYVSDNRRRAFVLAYPYNQNLTDIPHLYLAPTWAGLNDYLVGKGVLSKPAILV